MVVKFFERTFVSAIENVKLVIDENMAFIRENVKNISLEDFYDLKLVFNELVINAVVHGNKNDRKKFVALRTEILDGNVIKAVIIDQGCGYNYREILYSQKSSAVSYDENGRGVRLAASLTDKMAFNDKGNEVKFTKKVSING